MGFISKMKLKIMLMTISGHGFGKWILPEEGRQLFVFQGHLIHFAGPQRNENTDRDFK